MVQRSLDGRGLYVPCIGVLRNITLAITRWGGRGGPLVQRSSDGRGRINPRFRGKYIVHAIRHTSGREAILVRVN